MQAAFSFLEIDVTAASADALRAVLSYSPHSRAASPHAACFAWVVAAASQLIFQGRACFSTFPVLPYAFRAVFPTSFLASPSFCSSFNFRCCVCHGMFMTQCSGSNDVQPGHLFLFEKAFWSIAKPPHFKEKQSFSLVNSSYLGWVIAKRERLSKVRRGAWMPGRSRAAS